MELRSYLSPKTRVMKSPISGKGLFAIVPISKDEIISIKAGHIVDQKTLKRLGAVAVDSELQIDDGFSLAPLNKKERLSTMMFLNHSCDPNTGLKGNIVFVAMRNVRSGEELTMDYAIFDDADGYDMKCNCCTNKCRSIIKGGDWKKPILQKRYKGYFSAFIQRKIEILAKKGALG